MTEREIFVGALGTEAGPKRAQFLDLACGNDAALRARIARLLSNHDTSGTFLDKPIINGDSFRGTNFDFDRLTPNEECAEKPGTQIGAYRLVEPLGDGGMGTVWLAEQDQPVRRQVAIKLIKAGMDTRHVLARFEAERQALALMDHAHIAKVFDAGRTTVGRPYFVMELVRGVPVTTFCDSEKLALPDRLALFTSICQAVQHAHQKGIIHRDLKPSNILVGRSDGKPAVKIIDFGVAKALRDKLTDATLATAAGVMIGTPEYMAPEQALFDKFDADTRSDIYSLGIVLYELLVGSPPFSKEQWRSAGFEEMLRLIRQAEPPKPSAKLAAAPDVTAIAQRRRTEPRRLIHDVRGELDWIVMKCLEKERDRRYESANHLAEDLQRHLANEPVSAGPPSAVYRFKKFVRRHRGPVIAAAVIAASLVAGIISTATQWQRAEDEKQIAEAVRTFLQKDLLGQASPRNRAEAMRRVGGRPVIAPNPTVKDLLQQAAAQLTLDRIETKFPCQPRVQAAILQTIGEAFFSVGDTMAAIDHLERTRDIRMAVLGPNHPDTIATLNDLVVAYGVARRFDDAIALGEQLADQQERKLGAHHPETLNTLHNLAATYREAGQLDRAIEMYQSIWNERIKTVGPNHRDTLATAANLAGTYRAAGKLDKAIPILEQVRDQFVQSFGPDHPDTITALNELAFAYQDAGRPADAFPLFEQAANAIAKLDFQHEQAETIVQNVIITYELAGQFALAEPWRRKWLAVAKAKVGGDSPAYAKDLAALARNLVKQKKYGEAEPLARESFTVLSSKEPEEWRTFTTQSILGESLAGQNKFADAEPQLLAGYEGLNQRRDKIAPSVRNLRIGEAIERLVKLYDAWRKPEEAARWRKQK